MRPLFLKHEQDVRARRKHHDAQNESVPRPDRLNRALPKQRYRARKRYTLNSPVIEYASTKFRERFPVVCSDCNSGWMSALTLKIKESFSRTILHGEPFSLDAR